MTLNNNIGDSLLTRLEAAKYLKVTLPTLHSWTKSGYIFAYRIGKRAVYYRRNELDQALGRIEY